MANPSIGLKIANGYFYPILNENTEGKKKIVLTTIKDGQTSVQIDLYRKEDSERNEYIGSLRINHIKPAPAGEVEVELILGIDESGNLVASARDSSTGEYKTFSVRLEKLSRGDTVAGSPEYELESVADTTHNPAESAAEMAATDTDPASVSPSMPKTAPVREPSPGERKASWRQPLRPEPESIHGASLRREEPRENPPGRYSAESAAARPAAEYPLSDYPAGEPEERPSRFTAVREDEAVREDDPVEPSPSAPSRFSGERPYAGGGEEAHATAGRRKGNPVLLAVFVVLGLLFAGLIGYLVLLLLQGGGASPLEAASVGSRSVLASSGYLLPALQKR